MKPKTLTNQEILTKAYFAFNRRDIERVLELMQPDVDWANGMEGGRVRGRNAVREYWTRQWKILNPRVEPMDFKTEADGRTCVTVHTVVRDLQENVIHDGTIEHIYAIENGLIKSMEIRELP